MTEKAEIARDGARAQKNSGRGKWQKGDARLHPFVYDIKEYAKSFSVSRGVWSKTCTDAMRCGGEPALKLVLGEPGRQVRLWVVGDDMFKEMLEAWNERERTLTDQ